MKDFDTILIANDYAPVACEGKRPRASEWNTRPNTIETITAERESYPEATNTGLRTGELVGVDIDLIKPDDAAKIEVLAYEMLGKTLLKRVGAKGMMLCYRNAMPIKKITVAEQNVKEAAKIEILGTGQQFVAYGIHPVTGEPYTWPNSDDVSTLDPLNVSLEELPTVTPDMLREFAHLVRQLMEDLGYNAVKVTGDLSKEKSKTSSPRKGKPVTVEHVEELLSYIDPNIERRIWVIMGGVLHNLNIVGDIDGSLGQEIFHKWSEGTLDRYGRYKDFPPSRYTSSEDVNTAYDTMPPRPDGVGYGTLYYTAKKAGYPGPPAQQSTSEAFADAFNACSDGAEEIDEAQGKQAKDEFAERRGKYKGVKPSVGAKRPKPTFWDKDKTFPRSPAGGRIFVYAKYSQHKTNLVLAKCIDAILEHEARVLYVSPEDSDELFERIKAQCALRGITIESLDNNLVVVEVCPRIIDAAEIDVLMAEHEAFAPNIVVIDTWSEAMTGLDENSAKDASEAMHQVGRIRKKWRCEVILVHHEGKNNTKGARGSSVFLAGANAAWKISYDADRGIVTQYVEKLKGGKPKFSIYWGVKIFDDVMTVTHPDAVEAAAMRNVSEAPTRDTTPALKHQVIRAIYAAFKKDVLELDSRQIAEYINRNAPVANHDRVVTNDIQKIQRAVRGTKKKAGVLSDLVQLDTRGDPVSPYRFILPEHYLEELEDEENNDE